MKVFITGIRGFLGSNLAGALEARGHEVTGSSRDGSDVERSTARIRLGEPVDPAAFDDADTIVHCAHDFRPGAMELNVAGSRLLFDAGKGRHRIFVSSHSAREDAVGEYGISKYRIERIYLDRDAPAGGLAGGETVVRPGLVIGSGGLFGRSLRTIRNLRIIPLVDGGRDPVPVLAIADFCEAMINLIESGRRSAYNLFNATMPSMREILDTVLRLEARRTLVAPLPYALTLAAVKAAGRLSVPLAINAESLRTLRLNRRPVHESDLLKLVSRETNFKDAIARALGMMRG
jgi:nucleoside-diphosphate-sugar epimerase